MPIRKAFPLDMLINNLKANKRMTNEKINDLEIQINILKSKPSQNFSERQEQLSELQEQLDFHRQVIKEIDDTVRDKINKLEFAMTTEKNFITASETSKSMTEAANSLIGIKKKSAEDDGWLKATPVGAEREEHGDMIEDVDLSGGWSEREDEPEYDSVDDFMLNNEIEYAKHKKEAAMYARVDEVFNENPVYKRMKKQIEKGIEKYNTPVNPDHYSLIGWFNHLQEEMTDGITYNEIIISKLNEVASILKTGERASSVEMKHAAIEQALHVLLDGKE